MKTKLLFLALVILMGCKKESVPTPTITLDVTYLSNQDFLLKGNVNEKCFRGFIISGTAGAKYNDAEAATLGYDTGSGAFSMAIGLSRNTVYYFKAWGIVDGTSEYVYSEEQSFKTW